MKLSIVLGTGFGDEGKGNVTQWLTKDNDNSLVIRFNGGHQAGHTVIKDGISHVFSSFGSGTLNDTPTFWSKYCTIFPIGFNVEFQALLDKGFYPQIFVDPMCPITTPFDVQSGRADEHVNRHGSCGTGFGRTIWRHETLDHSYRIFAKDLFNEWILREKLKMIQEKLESSIGRNEQINEFIEQCKICSSRFTLMNESDIFRLGCKNIVFEGAQGILLDREHGVFPHVTRSHTTSKNALEIIERNIKYIIEIDIYYVSRCYQTRHGNGPLMGELPVEELGLTGIENETNQTNAWQGKFRYAPFNFAMYQHSIKTDSVYHDTFPISKKRVITCLDQFAENIPILKDNEETLVLDKHEFIERFPKGSIFSLSSDMSPLLML